MDERRTALPVTMDFRLTIALIASTIASIGGLLGGVFLFWRESFARRASHALMGFSAGVLLGVTLLDLMPEAIAGFPDPLAAMRYTLLGVVAFFLIERAISSMHKHQQEDEESTAALARAQPLVIVGDTVHNFLDGVVVAVTFVVSIPLGIATSVSVLLHELPHEIADFAILLRSGMKRRMVFMANFLSALVAPLGTLLGYLFSAHLEQIQRPLLAIAAGNLLYIALSDLLPHLHHERHGRRVILQLVMFMLGLSLFLFIVPRHE